MRFNFQHLLRAVILAIFATFFIKLHYTGDIIKYINPKYNWMSLITAGLFICLFLIQLCRVWESEEDNHAYCPPGCNHDEGGSSSFPKRLLGYVIIMLPLVTGFAFSPATLDASIAGKKGINLSQYSGNEAAMFMESSEPGAATENSQIIEHTIPLPNNNFITDDIYDEAMERLKAFDMIQMSDHIYASYYRAINTEPDSFMNRKINIKGFVYKEEGFNPDELVIARFVITHCIADASVIGFLSEFDQAINYEENTWIELEGTLDTKNYYGEEIPLIQVDTVKIIEEPVEPYIYPVMIKYD